MPLWWILWLVFLAIVGWVRYRAVSVEASARQPPSRRPASAAQRQAQHYKAKRKAKKRRQAETAERQAKHRRKSGRHARAAHKAKSRKKPSKTTSLLGTEAWRYVEGHFPDF